MAVQEAKTGGGPLTASTVLVRALVDTVQQSGVSRGELLCRADIEPGRLDDAAGRFDLAEFFRLEHCALDLTGDEGLGLHLAERTSDAAFDLLAHVGSHAPTLRDATVLCVQYGRFLIDGASLSLDEDGDSATLRCTFPRSDLRCDRFFAEFAVAGFLRMLHFFGGRNAAPQIAYFEHPKPTYSYEYRRLFRGTERFEQRLTGLSIARGILDQPNLHRHEELYATLRLIANKKLEQLTSELSYAARVKQQLFSADPAAFPDMETMARQLSTSTRSLRRRLADEGASYKDLVHTVRVEIATEMLRDAARSTEEVAYALGFPGVQAFRRALKRWNGGEPTAGD